MSDLVTSQVMVKYTSGTSPGARTLSVVFVLSFFSHVCVIVYSEMSVDSDRDSVIESEDGKETVVRQSFLFI